MLGKGFILAPEQAQALIERDVRNKDVLFPYLNGEDLNSRPDCSASRWVINFHDWTEERARSYPEVFEIVERDVKPERAKNNGLLAASGGGNLLNARRGSTRRLVILTESWW
ncbi:hypothetical protein [Streptomyces sp. B21-083]|uniref:hypothetical protein n=1 Tax=Streptomyces sp. B21-083 TaxID=3039410 RepID=UPI002FF22C58